MKNNSSEHYSRFKGFRTLVAMQLKDRLNFSFKANKKEALTKMILTFVLLGGMVGIIALIFYILNILGVLGTGGFVPVSMFNILFYLIITMNILSCIARLTNSLFFSEDNQTLLTYPVQANTIFLSKLVVFYIVEIIKSFTMFIPLFVAYAIIYGLPWYFYPWLILCFLIIALLPVAIASLICIPFMYVKMFFKRFQLVQSIAFFAFLIAVTVLIFWVVNLLPADLKVALLWSTKYFPAIVEFTQKAEVVFTPLVYLSTMLLGYKVGPSNNPKQLIIASGQSWIILAIVIGICAVSFFLSYLLAKPLFFSMASKPFEYKKILIPHNFKLQKNQTKDLYEQAIVPIYDHELSKHEQEEESKKLAKFLRKLNKEEKLFLRGKIDMKRISKFLNKYSKRKKGETSPFEIISLEEFKKREQFGYIIQYRLNIPSLVLVKKFKGNMMECYDPNYLAKKNHRMNSFLSTLFKELLLDVRTPGYILSNYMLFIVTPLAILVLNSVFAAMKQSTDGQLYTIFFNALIIGMILCASNVSMASIYSREGSASYLLKASPTNYMKSLATKLIIRAIIVIGSLIFTTIIYSWKCSLGYMRFDLFFFAFLFIYLGHLLWSAELDYMNPQDRLYAEVGQVGSITNPNETLSAVLSFIIAIVFAAIVYFFEKESLVDGFTRIFFVALIFFVCRLALFILKILGFGTSRSERGRD